MFFSFRPPHASSVSIMSVPMTIDGIWMIIAETVKNDTTSWKYKIPPVAWFKLTAKLIRMSVFNFNLIVHNVLNSYNISFQMFLALKFFALIKIGFSGKKGKFMIILGLLFRLMNDIVCSRLWHWYGRLFVLNWDQPFFSESIENYEPAKRHTKKQEIVNPLVIASPDTCMISRCPIPSGL